jgi:precorrin-2 methylase
MPLMAATILARPGIFDRASLIHRALDRSERNRHSTLPGTHAFVEFQRGLELAVRLEKQLATVQTVEGVQRMLQERAPDADSVIALVERFDEHARSLVCTYVLLT